MSSKRRTKARGFTLIELLVVIAIIAILAAILFPVLTNARRQGRVSSCQSNIRQIAVSVFMYADDNQGQMMPYDINHGDRPVKKMWFELLSPYMKAGKVYCCSELLNSKSTDTTTGNYNRIYGYGINCNVKRNNNPLKLSTVPRQSKILMLADAYTLETIDGRLTEVGFPVVYSQKTVPANGKKNALPYLADGNVSGRHGETWGRNPNDLEQGRTVIAYVDGHTKTWPRKHLLENPISPDKSSTGDIWGDFDVRLLD